MKIAQPDRSAQAAGIAKLVAIACDESENTAILADAARCPAEMVNCEPSRVRTLAKKAPVGVEPTMADLQSLWEWDTHRRLPIRVEKNRGFAKTPTPRFGSNRRGLGRFLEGYGTRDG
jgi:hypothetical protein